MIELWAPDKKLHLPSMPAKAQREEGGILVACTIELGAWDRHHRIIQQFREPLRSPVQQFLEILLRHMNADVGQTVTDTGGTARAIAPGSVVFDADALINDDTHGIVVGTGSTAVDIANSKLVTKIAAGIGAGQMIQAAMLFDATVTVTATQATFNMWRNFTNNSGGSITVAETGIYVQASQSNWYFCIFRDVPSSIAVPDGGGCYVKYTLEISE